MLCSVCLPPFDLIYAQWRPTFFLRSSLKSMTIPSSDVDTDVVRMRALADALAASFGDRIMWPCSALPSSLSGGEAEPELQEADELLPGLEPSHLSETAEGTKINTHHSLSLRQGQKTYLCVANCVDSWESMRHCTRSSRLLCTDRRKSRSADACVSYNKVKADGIRN